LAQSALSVVRNSDAIWRTSDHAFRTYRDD